MANRTLFNTQRKIAQTTGKNAAGGSAYIFTDEQSLCQYVVTGTLHQTFYATAADQLKQIENLVASVRPELIAKAAVYGHETGRMKDVPAYLLAVLLARGESALFEKAFNRVVTNAKMLCNFVQIVRSGVTGRKSFGIRTLMRPVTVSTPYKSERILLDYHSIKMSRTFILLVNSQFHCHYDMMLYFYLSNSSF